MEEVLKSIWERIVNGERAAYHEISRDYYLDAELKGLIEKILENKAESSPSHAALISREIKRCEEILMQIDERYLVDSLATGVRDDCEEAKAILYTVQEKSVRLRMTPDESADFGQDLYVEVEKSIKRNGSSFGTFYRLEGLIRDIARKRRIDRLRKKYIKIGQQMVQRETQFEVDEQKAEIDARVSTPEDILRDAETEFYVAASMERLPQELKEIAVLKWKGFENPDIAEMLGIPVPKVASRWFSGKQKLKKMLEFLRPVLIFWLAIRFIN